MKNKKKTYFTYKLRLIGYTSELLNDTCVQICINAPNEKIAKNKLQKLFGNVILDLFEKDFSEQY